MKVELLKNEAYVKVIVQNDGSLGFSYGWSIEPPTDGFDLERPLDAGIVDALEIIAGMVYLAQYETDQLASLGHSAIENGDFVFDTENGSAMAEFLDNLSEEDMELLHTPSQGEA